MSLLREVKPRNARTARIVKARDPQAQETRKSILILHGTRCPAPVQAVLSTIATLTKPHNTVLKRKNENVHPFESTESLEFLALKNEAGLVVFGTSNKKRPNTITVMRVFDGKCMDMVELIMIVQNGEYEDISGKGRRGNGVEGLRIGVEMKPMMIFAGSQWEDTSSSNTAATYGMIRSMLLDLFQGEEIPAVDVAGLQFILMVATGEQDNAKSEEDVTNRPVIHLRWYKVQTLRSTSPKIPRVELEPVGPVFDFRIGRTQNADENVMKEAMKHARRPNEAKTKKNIETDLMGDKLGRVHLGRQDLSQLQTRKMKGLKRTHDDLEDQIEINGNAVEEDDVISQDDEEEDDDMDIDGGVELNGEDGNSLGASGDEISIGDDSDEEMNDGDVENVLPKRQKLS